MTYVFDKNVDRRNTDSTKWDGMEARFGSGELLPFWIADTDFPVMPELVQAIEERAAHPSYGYSFASPAYYDSFIRWNRERNHFAVEREQVLSVPGVVCACAFTIYSLVSPGGKVMFCSPVYDPFLHSIEGLDRTPVVSSLKVRDGYYTMDFDDMDAKLADGVELLILCNPPTPVGRVWTREELERVGELCLKHQVPIFSDDIHSDIILPGYTYTPLPALSPEIADITVLAMAPSKTFNIAGLKSSLMVVPNPRLRKKINQGLQAFHMGVDLFGLKATEAAYRLGGPWVDQMNQYLLDSAKTVAEFCQNRLPKVKTRIPEGTYLMWLDCRGLGMDNETLRKFMIEKAGLGLNEGYTFGRSLTGYMRLNAACPRSILQQAMKQLRDAVDSYK